MHLHRYAFLLLLAAACTGPSMEVEFAEAPLTPAEMAAWRGPVVRTASGEITIRGVMETPSWCRELVADAVQAGSEVTLRVSSSESEGECPPGAGMWSYVAEIRDLARGNYTLRVVHAFADARRPSELVLTQPVVVR